MIEVTPLTLLTTIAACAGIAGLATAGIIGLRRNLRRSEAVDFQTVVARFPNEPRVPTGMAMFSEREEFEDALQPRAIGFLPELAMPYGDAAALREEFRGHHPDIYAAMAASLFEPSVRPCDPTDPSCPTPEGVYWSIDAQNFYGPDDRAMDQAFAEAWWPRMSEFPQR